jgi:hypothetical protein
VKQVEMTATKINAPTNGPPFENPYGLPNHAFEEPAEEIIGGMKQVITHAGPQNRQIRQGDILKTMQIARMVKVHV